MVYHVQEGARPLILSPVEIGKLPFFHISLIAIGLLVGDYARTLCFAEKEGVPTRSFSDVCLKVIPRSFN